MDKKHGEMVIIGGNSNPDFIKKVCDHIGIPPLHAKVSSFSDSEPDVEIYEPVTDKDVFAIQSVCKSFSHSVSDNFVELLTIIDALKRAGADRITAVMPYYGYARQDRRKMPGIRTPITAKLAADCITAVGAKRVLVMNLHAPQIQGFFNFSVDELFPTPIFKPFLKKNFGADICIVSPDAGGVERARAIAKMIEARLAIIDKRRDETNQAKAMNVIGDVAGLTAFLYDDIVDTVGSLKQGAIALKEKGAKEVHACCTHPVLSGRAIKNLEESPLTSLIVSDTIPLGPEASACGKIRVVSVANLIADAIININKGESVSSLVM